MAGLRLTLLGGFRAPARRRNLWKRSLIQAMSFIVRVTRHDAGGLSGTVERVRTGEKHRFRGVEALSGVIAQMAAKETEPAPSGGPPGGVGPGPDEETR